MQGKSGDEQVPHAAATRSALSMKVSTVSHLISRLQRHARRRLEKTIPFFRRFGTLPPGVHNLAAIHTLSLFFPLAGMLPSIVYTASWYGNSNVTFHSVDTAVRRSGNHIGGTADVRVAPVGAFLVEPFSTTSNFAFWVAGFGLFLMPCLSGDRMPSQTFVMAVLLVQLGTSSAAFHATGSVIGTWQHAADRMCMYMPFAFLCVAMMAALHAACWGQRASSRSTCGFVTNIGAITFMAVSLYYQAEYNSMGFLLPTGFVTFTLDYFTFASLHFHRFCGKKVPPPSAAQRRCYVIKAGVRALPSLFHKLSCLGLGFYLNLSGQASWRDFTRPSPNATHAELVEARKLYDFKHGSWHFLTAVVLMALGLTVVEGLSGQLEPLTSHADDHANRVLRRSPSVAAAQASPGAFVALDAEHRVRFHRAYLRAPHFDACRSVALYEHVSLVAAVALAACFAYLAYAKVDSHVWMITWSVVVALLLPVVGAMLLRIGHAHNRWLQDIQLLLDPEEERVAQQDEESARQRLCASKMRTQGSQMASMASEVAVHSDRI